jgi:nucleoprotein TPR
VEALRAAQKDLETQTTRISDLELRLNSERNSRETTEASFRSTRATLEQQLSDADGRNADLSKQNTLLHLQLERLGNEVKKLQTDAAAAATSTPSVAGVAAAAGSGAPSQEAKMNEELREVIKFLRREKEILEAKADASKQECVRLKQQTDHLSRVVDELRVSLRQVLVES